MKTKRNKTLRSWFIICMVLCVFVFPLTPGCVYADEFTVSLVGLESGMVFAAGDTITIGAKVDSAAVDSAEFFVNDETIGTGTPGEDGVYSIKWTPSTEGYYRIKAKAAAGTAEVYSDEAVAAVKEKTQLSYFNFQYTNGLGGSAGTTSGQKWEISKNQSVVADAVNGFAYEFVAFKNTTAKRVGSSANSPRWVEASFTSQQGGDGTDANSYLDAKFPAAVALNGTYQQTVKVSLSEGMLNGAVSIIARYLDSDNNVSNQIIGKLQGGRIYTASKNLETGEYTFTDTGVTYTADYNATADAAGQDSFKTVGAVYDLTGGKAYLYYDGIYCGAAKLELDGMAKLDRFRIEFDNRAEDSSYCAGQVSVDDYRINFLAELIPAIKMTALSDGTVVEKGAPITIRSYVTNVDSQPDTMSFYVGKSLIQTAARDENNTFSVSWTPENSGTNEITAKAEADGKVLSNALSIRVYEPNTLSVYDVQTADGSGNITDTALNTGSWVYKTTAANNTVTRFNYTGASGAANPRCLKTEYKSGGTSYLQLTFPQVENTGVYEYTYQVSFENDGGLNGASTMYLLDASAKAQNLVTLKEGKAFTYNSEGVADETGMSYTKSDKIGDNWYDLKIICDYDKNTKDVYFNNEPIGHSDFSQTTSTGWNRFRITMSPSTTGAIAIDNVYVKRLDAPLIDGNGIANAKFTVNNEEVTDITALNANDKVVFNAKAQSVKDGDFVVIIAHYSGDELKSAAISKCELSAYTAADVSAELELNTAPVSGDRIRAFIWENGSLRCLDADAEL